MMKKNVSLLLLFLLGFVFIGCQTISTTEVLTTEENIAALSDQLEGFSSYEDLSAYFSEMAFESRNNNVYAEDAVAVPGATDEATNEPEVSGDDKSHSETNVQVDGIAEMDTIITDGSYIYMARHQKLQIIDVDSMSIVYVNTLENGYYQGLFLYQDRLVAVYNQYTQYGTDEYYLYDFWWGYSSACVDVIDVSDKQNIEVDRTLEFMNAYITDLRMIEDELYFMMTSYQWNFYAYAEDVRTDETTDLITTDEITTEDDLVDVYVPKYKDSMVSDQFIPLSWSQIYYFPENDYTNSYLLVGSFSVNEETPIDIHAYLGYGFEVYMNHNNLYVAGSQYVYNEDDSSYTQYTGILRFEIINKKLVFKASNRIEGWTLNQFSFDEYDGVLRVASTIYSWNSETWESNITNQLYLLDATDDSLTLMSMLEGLGKPNERIYAVRMSGDIGYVVTFVNTDPMYKIDLSDPYNPSIIGELYEEGVSDYLHPYNDDLMIGIGRQAITQDGWTNFVGVKVALYDVSGDDPVTLETLLVEGEYSYSPATYNHKLFVEYNWNDDYLFAIPVYGYSNDYQQYYQAIYVYEIDGLSLIEKAVLIEENEMYYWGYIEKAIFIGDSIYTISYAQINEYDMNQDFEKVNSVILETFEYVEEKPVDDEPTTVVEPDEPTTSAVGDTTEDQVDPDSDRTE
jgi:uncharacterized secreted protein with C-terminal beta-propeller domain